jgi:membrane protease YdiL (CAAX protease family)
MRWAVLPYVATVIGLYVFDQALVAVGLYHAGIVIGLARNRHTVRLTLRGWRWSRGLVLSGVGFLTAPLIFFLWPVMVREGVDLGEQVRHWHLHGGIAGVFSLYAITVHPVLEERFWRGMLPDRLTVDLLFAGFHLLVLAPLIHAVWLPVVFGVLVTAAYIWRWMVREFGGLSVPVVSHALADLGVVLAVWQLTG